MFFHVLFILSAIVPHFLYVSKCYTQFSSSSSSCPFLCVCLCIIFVIPSISLLLSFDKVSLSPSLHSHLSLSCFYLLFVSNECSWWEYTMSSPFSYIATSLFNLSLLLCVYLCYWFNIWSHFDSPSLILSSSPFYLYPSILLAW